MTSLINKIAIVTTLIFYNTAQAPGIVDKGVHAEFVIADGGLSTWSSLIHHNFPQSNRA